MGKCDATGCQNESTMMGQGFEAGKSISQRCGEHAWNAEEMKAMLAEAARSRQAYDSLSSEQQEALIQAPAEDHEQLWNALIHGQDES